MVKLKQTDKIYAMKVIKKSIIDDEEDIEWVQTEKHVFEQASNHPFLVSMGGGAFLPLTLTANSTWNLCRCSGMWSFFLIWISMGSYSPWNPETTSFDSWLFSGWTSLMFPDPQQNLLCYWVCQWRRPDVPHAKSKSELLIYNLTLWPAALW